MWVPRDPPKPEFNLDRLVNFDWGLGHIANVGNISYEELLSMQDSFELIDVSEEEAWWEEIIEYYESGISDGSLYVTEVADSFVSLPQEAIYATSDSSFGNDLNPDETMLDTSDVSSTDAVEFDQGVDSETTEIFE